MPATGLKLVGTGTCLPWCSISSSFQNSLKMSGHQGYEFLEFWCWNLVPLLPDIGFQLLKRLWSSLTYFVLYRLKIWTEGRPIPHSDSSTTKLCCCNSCSTWYCIVLLKYTSSGGEHMSSLLFSPDDTASLISNKNVKFGLARALNTFPLWNSPF